MERITEGGMQETNKYLSQTRDFLEFLRNTTPHYTLAYNDVILIEKLVAESHKEKVSLVKEVMGEAAKILPVLSATPTLEDVFRDVKDKLLRSYRLRNLHFRQTTPLTCSIACFLMALSIYRREFKPTKEAEISFYRQLVEPGAEVVEIYNLVREAISRGLFVKVFSVFDYTKKTFTDPAVEKRRLRYLSTMDELRSSPRFREFTEVRVGPFLFRQLLQDGEAVLVNGMTNGIIHMRLFIGYEGENFIVSDPLNHQKEVFTPAMIETTCSPPYGKWCMTASSRPFTLSSAIK